MTTAELKVLIEEKFGLDRLKEMVEEEAWQQEGELHPDIQELKEKTGLLFEFAGGERINESYFWTWQLGDKYYQIMGDYDSWNGTQMDHIKNFYEVEKVQKVIEIWVEKKG